jgi:hypothetical protein
MPMLNNFKLSSILALVTFTFASFTAAQTVTVPQGTSIRLRLSQNVSSADAKAGDAITLEVLDDVKVDQVIAIRHGAQARGKVTEAHSKRRMGRAGAVAVNIASVEAADGTRVPVSVERKSKGDNKSGTITAGIVGSAVLFFPAAPFFLLMHGKDTNIPAGTPVEVFASNDTDVNMSNAPAALVPIAKVVTPPEHVIEGYTINSSDSMNASGDGSSIADAARQTKARKAAAKTATPPNIE